MTTNEKPDPTNTPDGTVEIEEAQLDQVAGGAIYIKYGDIKGEIQSESRISTGPGLTTRP